MCAMFAPAVRNKLKLRMAICSPAGYGKSYTGLILAAALAKAGSNGQPMRVAAIDTEHGALSKYAGMIHVDGVAPTFDVCELQHFAPSAYAAAIREAASAGYGVLIIDSLSHAWSGVGGALAQVDQKAAVGGNSFTAWKDVTPQHNELVEAILAYPGHVIATMRTKMEYVLEEEDRKGRKVMVPKKVGMKPIQREGMDYEFDIVADMDETHTLIVGKTRCPAIDGQRVVKPGPEFLTPVIQWLDVGADAPCAPSAPKFMPDAIVTASDLQVSEISIACQTLELQGQPAAMLAKRGVSRLEDLTHSQADEILATLRKKIQARKLELDVQLAAVEKVKKEAASVTPDPTQDSANTAGASANLSMPPASESTTPAKTADETSSETPVDPDRLGSISDHDQKRIVAYCQKLAIGDSDLVRILGKRMTNSNPPHPVRSVPDLSHNQAQDMIANLRTALQKRFPDTTPF